MHHDDHQHQTIPSLMHSKPIQHLVSDSFPLFGRRRVPKGGMIEDTSARLAGLDLPAAESDGRGRRAARMGTGEGTLP